MRFDNYLAEKGFYSSRTKAAQAIEKGQVTVNGELKKGSYDVKESDVVSIIEAQKFVSMGGYKLEKSINDFSLELKGLVVADIGASTGGFTDCLLQCGAQKVFAIDVGESLLDEKLAKDERVVAIDNQNARFLNENSLPVKVDGAVIDCSFISLKLVLNAVKSILKPDGWIVALIKPQFECGKSGLGKSGIVCDEKVRVSVCEEIFEFASNCGINPVDFTVAPKRLGKNFEYLIMLGGQRRKMNKSQIKAVISCAK